MTLIDRIKTLFPPFSSAAQKSAQLQSAGASLHSIHLSESESEFLVGATSLNQPPSGLSVDLHGRIIIKTSAILKGVSCIISSTVFQQS